MTTAYFTVAPEQFDSPRLAEMQRRLEEVGVFAARNPIEGWPDLEFQIDHATFHGEEIIELKVEELVRVRSRPTV